MRRITLFYYCSLAPPVSPQIRAQISRRSSTGRLKMHGKVEIEESWGTLMWGHLASHVLLNATPEMYSMCPNHPTYDLLNMTIVWLEKRRFTCMARLSLVISEKCWILFSGGKTVTFFEASLDFTSKLTLKRIDPRSPRIYVHWWSDFFYLRDKWKNSIRMDT